VVKLLGITPALLNNVKFSMKLGEENYLKSMSTAGCLKYSVNMCKVWFIEQYVMAAAIQGRWGTIE
jgi:hypothetical protein